MTVRAELLIKKSNMKMFKCKYLFRTDYIEAENIEYATEIFFARLAKSLDVVFNNQIIIEDITLEKSN